MNILPAITPAALLPGIRQLWTLSGEKIHRLFREYDPTQGSPVFTVEGRYTSRGWTEWTEGFHYGSAFLQFDATGDPAILAQACAATVLRMASHVSHMGVHDHGFNNVSTYGNWLRLLREGRLPMEEARRDFCELALKVSGAVQAARWSRLNEGGGYIYSFNGPHSLFVDTVRSCRAVVLSHRLGHKLMDENDAPINLLERALHHLQATARYSVYYGEGRDRYDELGRTAHESIFNPKDGRYRCPNSQQGYSGFTTWTRGLAWAMLGFAEQWEFLQTIPATEMGRLGGHEQWAAILRAAAIATSEWYLANTPSDGIPYWDGGAPGLASLGDWRARPAEPHNDHEPVDSSAAAIGAQGLLRLGRCLGADTPEGHRYFQAGLSVLQTLLTPAYTSHNLSHHGLLLHSVYHHPNRWDHIPAGRKVPCDESSMWGDYHLRELALLVQRLAEGKPYLTFFACLDHGL